MYATNTAGQPNHAATSGPVACPTANPTGPLAVNVPTAVARTSATTASLTSSIPAFQTMTYATPPSTREPSTPANDPARPARYPPAPATSSAPTATAIARRESVRSRTPPTGRLATTAVPNITPTTSPAADALTPSESRTSGVTLAGAIS